MRLYYITDRKQFPGDSPAQIHALLRCVRECARAGIDWIQLREKDLSARELETLAIEVVKIVRAESQTTKLLINSRADIAIATDADGVHLASHEVSAADVRAVGAKPMIIGVSCHSASEVRMAESQGADFAVLAPIFEKAVAGLNGIGTDELRRATTKGHAVRKQLECSGERSAFPVLALGGVNEQNSAACLQVGASGVAGIRLFQQSSNIKELVDRLRALEMS